MSLYRNLTHFMCFLLVFLGAATALAQDAPISDKAKQHFEAGVSFADDPDGPKWEEACREFQAAFADSPNYQFMNNLGLCALNLERDADAIAAYEGFLAKATVEDIPPKKRKRVEKDIQMLKMGLVRLTLTTHPESVVLVDERVPAKGNPIINRYAVTLGRTSLGIHPGHHKITATAEGYQPVTWEFDAANAATLSHEFRLEPTELAAPAGTGRPKAGSSAAAPGAPAPATDPSKSGMPSDVTAPPRPTKKTPTMVYVGAGATGLFAIGAVVLGLEAVSKNNELKDKNDGKHIAEAEGLQKDAKLFALLSDVGTGAAVICALGTAYLYFSNSGKPVEAPKTARLRVVPAFGQTNASMNIFGEF